MKAIVVPKYGSPDVLEIRELDKPAPADDEILVKVRASSVNPAEWYRLTGLIAARLGQGWVRPKDIRLGADFAGVVEAVGRNVSDFKAGDAVFGGRSGAFAEYLTVRRAIAPMPANLTFEEAAAVPTAAVTAWQGLHDHGRLQPGQSVLINGASGGVGTFAVQIAKAGGAEVTAVCSTRNAARARALGADHVVDYTQTDFTRGGRRYDLLLDVAGGRSWFDIQRVLQPAARVVVVGGPHTPVIGPLGHVLQMRLASLGSRHPVIFFMAAFSREVLLTLKALLESGQVKPFVEQTYPLAQVAAAMRHVGAGHAQGKIVLSLGSPLAA